MKFSMTRRKVVPSHISSLIGASLTFPQSGYPSSSAFRFLKKNQGFKPIFRSGRLPCGWQTGDRIRGGVVYVASDCARCIS
jgi:hypothetical protein